MKKAELLYGGLISSISRICSESAEVEEYWESLNEEDKNGFDGISEALERERNILLVCVEELVFYERLDVLKNLLDSFNDRFTNFHWYCHRKVGFIISIAKEISRSSSEIPDEEPHVEFGFGEVALGFECLAYASNTLDINDNIVWVNPSSSDSLSRLADYNLDSELLYAILACAERMDFTKDVEFLFCKKSRLDGGVDQSILSLLKLHLAASGEVFQRSIDYCKKPSSTSVKKCESSLPYSQFSEVISILGEYNSQKNILSKYISIYHVVENFMFRAPIVRLERSVEGAMFSIRDFKRLYKAVEVNELQALSALVKEGFSLQFSGEAFGAYAFRAWSDFTVRNHDMIMHVDDFLKRISILDLASVNSGSFYSFFARAIYNVRCSVVHNKETEFHVSGDNYLPGCKLLLEDYLVGMIEEFVFLLLSAENELVWYKSDSIPLWKRIA